MRKAHCKMSHIFILIHFLIPEENGVQWILTAHVEKYENYLAKAVKFMKIIDQSSWRMDSKNNKLFTFSVIGTHLFRQTLEKLY